jgi:hypothetical protein
MSYQLWSNPMNFQSIEKLAKTIQFPKFLHKFLVNMQFQSVEKLAENIHHPLFNKSAFTLEMEDTEFLINSLVQARFSNEVFYANYQKIFGSQLDLTSGNTLGLSVGDLVTYTNTFGVSYPNHRILGFLNPSNGELKVFLDVDSCFSAVSFFDVTLQSGYVGIEPIDLITVSEKHKYNPLPLAVQMVREENGAVA